MALDFLSRLCKLVHLVGGDRGAGAREKGYGRRESSGDGKRETTLIKRLKIIIIIILTLSCCSIYI